MSIDLIWDQRIQILVSYDIIKIFGKSFQKLDNMFKSHKLLEKVLLSVNTKKNKKRHLAFILFILEKLDKIGHILKIYLFPRGDWVLR